jgi:hypothetical protein
VSYSFRFFIPSFSLLLCIPFSCVLSFLLMSFLSFKLIRSNQYIKTAVMINLFCVYTHWKSLPNFCHQQIVVSITFCCRVISDMMYTWIMFHIYRNANIFIWVFPSADVQVNLWMLLCRNTMLLDVSVLSALAPLSVVISCKLSLPVVGLKISLLRTLAFKSATKILMRSVCFLRQWDIRVCVKFYVGQLKSNQS